MKKVNLPPELEQARETFDKGEGLEIETSGRVHTPGTDPQPDHGKDDEHGHKGKGPKKNPPTKSFGWWL